MLKKLVPAVLGALLIASPVIGVTTAMAAPATKTAHHKVVKHKMAHHMAKKHAMKHKVVKHHPMKKKAAKKG
jgi:hypothetical protein